MILRFIQYVVLLPSSIHTASTLFAPLNLTALLSWDLQVCLDLGTSSWILFYYMASIYPGNLAGVGGGSPAQLLQHTSSAYIHAVSAFRDF